MPDQGVKKQTLIVAVFLSFVCGFLAGAGFAIYKTAPSTSPPISTHAAKTESQSGISEQQKKTIEDLEVQVAANPKDFQLWTQLGNTYYDANQPEMAIKAYTRSLELHAGDANLLTDLGVMYRSIGQPKKALEYFEQAITLDPTHEPSRLNKGIVLMYDLHSPDKAIATWEELLRIDPEARTASGESVRDLIKEVKNEPEVTPNSTGKYDAQKETL
jgi:tetratricopeptide (TPR) repeat protein